MSRRSKIGVEKELTSRSVGLDPGHLGEDESGEALTEVLDHVVALGLSVDEHVEADLLLDVDDALDLLLDERVVLGGGDGALDEVGAREADLLGLGERSDRGGGWRRGISEAFQDM